MQSAVVVIAIKEFRDIFRTKTFVIILGLLFFMSMVTVILGSAQVHQKVDAYQKSIEFLKSLGRTELPPMPNLNPIAVSKNFVNYIGMIGALLAMILGYNAISKERKNGTLTLILSRPIYRDQLINGKILGNVMVLLTILVVIGGSTIAFINLTSGVTLTSTEIIKIILFFGMSLLYLLIFFALAFWMTIKIPQKNNAILLTIIIWLVVAFIFPQVGDTMDLDNQLPGGFFAQMGMTKTQEKQVVSKFHWYETVRDGIEEMSPTKHYERMSFALLGIKPEFIDNTPLEVVKLKWLNLVGLTIPTLILLILSYVEFLKKS
ncbi:MAG: ABC transporter permease subunit [Carboxydocellales bacterium]